MGFFSGSFGAGLAQGLASSVDRQLQTAMDKRDEDVSRARQFWEMRQAQKMDLADEHDRRAKDALESFIQEFGGDVAKGLAAYQAVGGTVDKAENYLSRIESTRAAGIDYSMSEKFAFDNIDLSQYADLSREDAFSSIRMDLPEVSAEFEETGLLKNLGLGLRADVGQDISDSVNQLMPARPRTPIAGLSGATYDPSGTLEATETQLNLALLRARLADLTEPKPETPAFRPDRILDIFDSEYSAAASDRASGFSSTDAATSGTFMDEAGNNTIMLGDNAVRAREADIDARLEKFAYDWLVDSNGLVNESLATAFRNARGVSEEYIDRAITRRLSEKESAEAEAAALSTQINAMESTVQNDGSTYLPPELDTVTPAFDFAATQNSIREERQGFISNIVANLTESNIEVAEDGSVEARPPEVTGINRASGVFLENRKQQQDEWDRTFGTTHNSDGSLKDTLGGNVVTAENALSLIRANPQEYFVNAVTQARNNDGTLSPKDRSRIIADLSAADVPEEEILRLLNNL